MKIKKIIKKSLAALLATSLTFSCASTTRLGMKRYINTETVEENLGIEVEEEDLPYFKLNMEESKLKIKAMLGKFKVPYKKSQIKSIENYEQEIIEETDYTGYAILCLPLLFLFFIPGFICYLALPDDLKKTKVVGKEPIKEYKYSGVKKKPLYEKREFLKYIKPLSNAVIDIKSEELDLETQVQTDDNGIAYLDLVDEDILDFSKFKRLQEVQMFEGICDLRKAYDELEKRKIRVEIFYEGKKYNENLEIKVKSQDSILNALKKAGCI